MQNDDFHIIPKNISTVVDLLESKGIAWAEYEQDMPYAGFTGYNFSDQKTYDLDYMRKHNPLIEFESVASNSSRVRQIKNFTSFEEDLKNKKLPQWGEHVPSFELVP